MADTQRRILDDQVATLENILLDVRQAIGDVQRTVLVNLQKGSDNKDIALTEGKKSYKLKDHCKVGYLKEREGVIHALINEILDDSCLTIADPLLSREENARRFAQYRSAALEVSMLSVTLANGMDFIGLVELSKRAAEMYDLLKPVALESRNYDHRTGLRVSDWLMNTQFFDYLKDYFANPNNHISLINMDLNKFKAINGIVGKEQADIVITQVARILKELPEGVAVRRTKDAADEFYVCLRTDAEGAWNIINHCFVKPLEEKLVPYVREACERELPEGFNDAVKEYTFAIGITSTYIPGAPSIFKRAIKALSDGEDKVVLKQEFAALDNTAPEKRAKAYRGELTGLRYAILKTLRQVMETESEKAMKAAKLQDHDRNTIFVYDPSLTSAAYVYKPGK